MASREDEAQADGAGGGKRESMGEYASSGQRNFEEEGEQQQNMHSFSFLFMLGWGARRSILRCGMPSILCHVSGIRMLLFHVTQNCLVLYDTGMYAYVYYDLFYRNGKKRVGL